MVRVPLLVFEIALLALIAYNLTTALAGWRNQIPAPVGERRRRFRVVVPAHDEATVVGSLLGDLAVQSYPTDLTRVVALADRCTDHTADIARAAGVEVAERSDGRDGKGAALAWYLHQDPLAPDEALVVLDADNRIPPDLLARFSDELDQGHSVLQAYLDVANPDASLVATASALSYWASNRMVQLARTNLGWTADLGGTGMCLTAGALADAGGFGPSLVEDQDLGVRLFEAGHRVRWVHDVRIRDEKPAAAGVAVRQRSRWAAGRRQVARHHAPRLVAKGGLSSIDLAVRLVQPSRMGVAVASAGLALLSAVGVPLLSAWAWGAVALVQLLAPVPFLARDGVERRYVIRYPVLVLLPLLKLPARFLRQQGWYHTPHQG